MWHGQLTDQQIKKYNLKTTFFLDLFCHNSGKWSKIPYVHPNLQAPLEVLGPAGRKSVASAFSTTF
jgi:hypothetical protein